MEPDAPAPGGSTPARGRPTTVDPLRGRLLEGRYLIGARIARGGMASVYEAHDERLDRTVAVKVMHAGLGDDPGNRDFAERFVREARAAARLSHPNVVAVHDQGDEDGTVFLVMELITGHTLRDTIVKESPMSPARALALMDPVVSALASAHRSGLIHRDIKPENVLIADDGRVKVADFGLAKAISADTQHTATQGVLIGTVSYLAPELVVDGSADARADVYALGVVLYELLTGVKPHEGETPIQVAYKHVHHDVPPPSERVPELPAYVDALVARATSRDRDHRPADAGVFLHQLHRVAQALAAGVRDDPELTLDLTPLRGPSGQSSAFVDAGTTPEPWDRTRLDAQLNARPGGPPRVREHTTMLPVQQPPAGMSSKAAPRGEPTPDRLVKAPKPPRAPRPPKQRRSRRGPIVLVLALVLALAIGGGAYWYGEARYASAPSVLGVDDAGAVRALEGAELVVAYTDPVYDSDVPKGSVVSADPGGGARVLPGDTVTVTLSLGKLLVPKVRGLDEDAAQDALLARQLDFGESRLRYSENNEAGTVLGSVPKQGVELEPGATVDLIISNGRRPIPVGRWVDQDIDAVREALERRGLVVNVVSEDYDDTIVEGNVLTQDPADGVLNRGDVVSLTVSRGPELVSVPSVRAYGVDAAVDALESDGFVVTIERNIEYLGIGFAVRTDPPSGSLIPKGSTVTVYVI